MSTCDIGLIGLAVMGENLVLNMESRGFHVAVFNRTTSVVEAFEASRGKGKNFVFAKTLPDFVAALKRPRKAQIMVKAGAPVDAVIEQLIPLLEPGDIIIDGGNSLWTDTQRREKYLKEKGLHFFGVGVSGGEEGALKGPSIMPGGSKQGWEALAPIYTKIAAVAEGEPCCRHMGPDGAGHYVKMAHNGIEYGDMQLICEAYAILKAALNPSADEFAEIFGEWNKGKLDSFLIDITTKIFSRKDPETGKAIVDLVLDKAGQKGTGKWTVGHAVEMGVPLSVIGSAVEARILSSLKDERVAASAVLPGPTAKPFTGDRAKLIEAVRDALYASKIISYAQGMVQLGAASKLYNWNLNFGDIASIWRGGCIIRARFLNRITDAYRSNPDLKNLILDPFFRDTLLETQANWRSAVTTAIEYGVAVPAFSSALSYFDSYRQANLPANLLQAQRDYFGAHTYERIDKPRGEFFHFDWLNP
ncbi:MAG TPA: decarboxylating NADP(+)-dependent phosphogluconate dehydrogenase [Chthoniobacteraceae bacterium]|jgi:6-phosphogluconate dehydrogenase|nr:gndA [Chthoniobacter sp.]HEV7868903.1 decarboxylating NADP(+)-dependent phosphogluconate dehydrogenase [Chthoniobacteraceae bacterium]